MKKQDTRGAAPPATSAAQNITDEMVDGAEGANLKALWEIAFDGARKYPKDAASKIRAALKAQLRRHTNIQDAMRMIVLPFEEYHSIDGARLQLCKAGFAYEDPDTDEIKTVSVCAWSLFRTDIQRKIAEKYSAKDREAKAQGV